MLDMRKVFLGCLSLSTILLTAGLLSLGYKVAKTLDKLDTSLSQTQQDIHRLSDDLHGTSQNLNAALIQIGLTSDEARRAAIEQRAYWAKNSAETHTLLANLNDTVTTAKGALVVLTMDAHAQINTNGGALTASLDQMRTGLLNVSNAAEDVDRTVLHINSSLYQAGPDVQSTLDNLNKTSENVANATKSISLASNDIQVKVHQLTRPAKWWMSVGRAVISAGSTAGSYLAGFFK
jgi:methyl-accepting chemotaxis protein